MARMNFKLKAPCVACPFTKGEEAVRLPRDRTVEIAMTAIGEPGGPFPCHMTNPETSEHTGEQSQCAGALAFAANCDRYSNYLRIMGRLNAFHPDELLGRDRVFRSLPEMLRCALGAGRGR